MHKPKAIVFDYGGTLVSEKYFDPLNGTREVLKFANNPRNIPAEIVQSYADKLIDELGAFTSTSLMQLDGRALNRLIHSVHGITFEKSYDELDLIFLDAAEGTALMEGIVKLLDYLTDQGIRLGVLSNTGFMESSHRFQLRKYGIEKYFEFFIATSEYLVRKPDKRIFDVALAKLELEPEDVWYVGNMYEFDVQGAYNAGIYPIWINTENKLIKSDINYLNVNSYIDLYDILNRHWNDNY